MLIQLFNTLGYIGWFKWNQQEIAAIFCENKQLPSKHCDGKCYLMKQIDRTEDAKSSPIRIQSEQTEIYFLESKTTKLKAAFIFDSPLLFYNKTAIQQSGFPVEVFQPPC